MYDLCWKLVGVLHGWGGPGLLASYDRERRPVAELNTSMVEKGTMEVALPWMMKAQEIGRDKLMETTEDGQRSRDALRDQIMPGRWLHEQFGTVMGYRYNGSPIVIADPSASEPRTSITEYIPSTWPGPRAPHVFLTDGKTSIFDRYGPDFTIVDFTVAGHAADEFVAVAATLNVPITKLHLPDELYCRAIWERDVVLVRPDGFVAWRSLPDESLSIDGEKVKNILLIATGRQAPN